MTARSKNCGKARPPSKPADATAVFEVTLDWMRGLRRRIECRRLEDGDWPFLGALVSNQIAREEDRQARRLAKLLEKAAANGDTPADDSSDESATAADGSAAAGAAPQAGQAPGEGEPAETAEGDGNDPPADPKGHGRNGKDAYKNAQHFFYALAFGVIGAVCEECGIGKMQAYREKVFIRIVGQPMLAAECHHYAQARCRNCGHIVRAEGPAGVFEGLGSDYVRYAWSACAMLAVLHYTSSSPFKRLESLHQGWGIPLADANQWELVSAGDDRLLPLYRALERHAIQTATNFRIDDTGSMVIALQRQITAELAALESLGESTKNVRTGINATGLYWETPSGPVILFYTGRHHAGEIVDQVLRHRLVNSPKLVKCTDGASKNFDHQHADKLVESTCNAHALLKFRAIKDKHPVEYAEAGKIYKQVFDNDDKARDLGLTPIDRMRFHREHSKPLMEQLRKMCEQRLASKTVEPNSPLWEPLSFVINQWDRLTQFYKTSGVPLDTNLVEQALIVPVRYQAASFNYQTQDGALVGDHFMSLIATARANGVEPVAYLAECLRCHEDLAKRPEHYLPWAFAQRLEEGQVPAWPPQQRGAPAPAPPAPDYATLRHSAGKEQLDGSPPQSKTCSSRESSGEQVPSPVGHAAKRPFDKRFVHSQNPAPS